MQEINIRFKTLKEHKEDLNLDYGSNEHRIPVVVAIDGKPIERLKSFSIKIDESNTPNDVSYVLEQYMSYSYDDEE